MPLKRDISLPSSKTPQYIASEIALLPGGRWSKGCWVESFASRILRPIEHKRPAQITARPEAKISRSSSGFFTDVVTQSDNIAVSSSSHRVAPVAYLAKYFFPTLFRASSSSKSFSPRRNRILYFLYISWRPASEAGPPRVLDRQLASVMFGCDNKDSKQSTAV